MSYPIDKSFKLRTMALPLSNGSAYALAGSVNADSVNRSLIGPKTRFTEPLGAKDCGLLIIKVNDARNLRRFLHLLPSWKQWLDRLLSEIRSFQKTVNDYFNDIDLQITLALEEAN